MADSDTDQIRQRASAWDLVEGLRKYGRLLNDTAELLENLLERPAVPPRNGITISTDEASGRYKIEMLGTEPLLVEKSRNITKVLEEMLHRLANE